MQARHIIGTSISFDFHPGLEKEIAITVLRAIIKKVERDGLDPAQFIEMLVSVQGEIPQRMQ